MIIELFCLMFQKVWAVKGKSRALNLALEIVESETIAIYDADNTPDKNALKYLAAQLIRKYRTWCCSWKIQND